jgi:hypothetical protein
MLCEERPGAVDLSGMSRLAAGTRFTIGPTLHLGQGNPGLPIILGLAVVRTLTR